VSDSIVGIDVSKDALDANCARGQRKQARTFENNPDRWKRLLAWLKAMGSQQAHVCMEATGRHSLGIALALHDAGHVISVVNPAQIRDFARTKLGRNKTDKGRCHPEPRICRVIQACTMDAAVACDATTVRAADRARRNRQEQDGVEEPHRQRSR
jgi:transposase